MPKENLRKQLLDLRMQFVLEKDLSKKEELKQQVNEIHNEFARVSRIEIENEKKRGR